MSTPFKTRWSPLLCAALVTLLQLIIVLSESPEVQEVFFYEYFLRDLDLFCSPAFVTPSFGFWFKDINYFKQQQKLT